MVQVSIRLLYSGCAKDKVKISRGWEHRLPPSEIRRGCGSLSWLDGRVGQPPVEEGLVEVVSSREKNLGIPSEPRPWLRAGGVSHSTSDLSSGFGCLARYWWYSPAAVAPKSTRCRHHRAHPFTKNVS